MSRKIFRLVFVLLVLFSCLKIDHFKADGETLQDLLNNLDELEVKMVAINDEKKLSEEKLNEITLKIVNTGIRINEIENEIINSQKEIEDLTDDIELKKKQIRDLASALQKNNGDENFYLEFIFGADTLTDFIYRKQVVEKITEYNDRTINTYRDKIEKLKEKGIELDEEKNELEKENVSLKEEQEELGSQINILDEDARDILEDIADVRSAINAYQRMGCKLTDLLENCTVIPADALFLRPLMQGRITSGYGARENPLVGGYQFHAAVDIGGNPPGTSVYATASGIVVLAYTVENPDIPNSHCGGNHVIIQHKIGNTYYASRYMHLSKVYVTEGQSVSANDIIGAVGGGEIYDRCSTGPHLDFSIAKGIYGQDFWMFRQPYTVNPYTLVNLPELGVYYSNRFERF